VARMFNVNGMQSLVGTLPYMAPEMLMQAQPYNEKVDMWSVYCCLFELTCPDKDLQELCSDVPGFGRIPVDEASAIQLGRVRQDTIRASIPAVRTNVVAHAARVSTSRVTHASMRSLSRRQDLQRRVPLLHHGALPSRTRKAPIGLRHSATSVCRSLAR